MLVKPAEHVYPHCPSCKGEGHYLLAGKDWPCTWCNIEYQREPCLHEFKLNSMIPFSETRFLICFREPIKDFDICINCGIIKNIVYGGESRCWEGRVPVVS